MSRKVTGFVLLLAASAFTTLPAWAGNGNALHGIGAVNSSMGGAGVALPNDALGALNLNPALLTQLDGHKFEFSAELADDDITVESQVGPFKGKTEHAADPALIPAFGFTAHKPGGKLAYGVGFLGMAGFGADFPQDSTNPIFAPQPFGFGHVFSGYALMKVPVMAAYQVNDNLSIGGAFIAGRASLTARPAGFATPDCSAGGVCFVPSTDSDSAWGFGAQVGVFYKINDVFSIGGSYQSEMEFEDFEWNSAVANPNLPTFGTARKLKLQVNNPANAVLGIGITPSDRLKIALDAKQLYFARHRRLRHRAGLAGHHGLRPGRPVPGDAEAHPARRLQPDRERHPGRGHLLQRGVPGHLRQARVRRHGHPGDAVPDHERRLLPRLLREDLRPLHLPRLRPRPGHPRDHRDDAQQHRGHLLVQPLRPAPRPSQEGSPRAPLLFFLPGCPPPPLFLHLTGNAANAALKF